MGIFSKFEGHMEDGLEGAADKMFDAPISPVQISKKAEKAMRREKMVGAGKQYAPTLYTVLVNPSDDQRLFGYYPTLAGETETYLSARAAEEGLLMDGQPLVRFIVDDGLKRGKFDIIAELVSAPIIAQLRQEEMQRYGLAPQSDARPSRPYAPQQHQAAQRQATRNSQHARQQHQQQQGYAATPKQAAGMVEGAGATAIPGAAAAGMAAGAEYAQRRQPAPKQQLPYVPEEEIDRSIDYGDYTFNSQDFDNYNENGLSGNDLSGLDVKSYDPYLDSQSFRNQQPAYGKTAQPAQAHYPGSRDGFPDAAPDTVVFAAGVGNVNPVPDRTAVRARLVNTTTQQAIDLASNRLIMGRSSSSSIVLDDINASRSHAELCLEPQGVWSITDLGSTNGTLVNGRRITAQTLTDGDRISIGMTDFVFTLC